MRQLFQKLWKSSNNAFSSTEYYPMQTDIAFDFARKMCNQENPKVCLKLCPFGKFKERNSLCVKDKNKKCPLLLYTCGYVNNCEPSDCIIIENKELWDNEKLKICIM